MNEIAANLRYVLQNSASTTSLVNTSISIRGALILPGTKVKGDCEFVLTERLLDLPPAVRCFNKWIRREIDWHVYNDGTLCYELPQRWKDVLAQIDTENGERVAGICALDWCLAGVRKLLSFHLIAYSEGLRTWPKSWQAWKHFPGGPIQYLREKAEQK